MIVLKLFSQSILEKRNLVIRQIILEKYRFNIRKSNHKRNSIHLNRLISANNSPFRNNKNINSGHKSK